MYCLISKDMKTCHPLPQACEELCVSFFGLHIPVIHILIHSTNTFCIPWTWHTVVFLYKVSFSFDLSTECCQLEENEPLNHKSDHFLSLLQTLQWLLVSLTVKVYFLSVNLALVDSRTFPPILFSCSTLAAMTLLLLLELATCASASEPYVSGSPCLECSSIHQTPARPTPSPPLIPWWNFPFSLRSVLIVFLIAI